MRRPTPIAGLKSWVWDTQNAPQATQNTPSKIPTIATTRTMAIQPIAALRRHAAKAPLSMQSGAFAEAASFGCSFRDKFGTKF